MSWEWRTVVAMDYVMTVRMIITAMSGFLVGTTLVVAAVYARQSFRARGTRDGLLPAHVWTVALSYDLLLLYASIEVGMRVDDATQVTWRSPVLGAAYVLGLIAMWKIGSLRRGR